jgi:hypothetical protein
VGYDRQPRWGYGNRGPKPSHDDLDKTYNDLRIIATEDSGKFYRLKETLDKTVAWMGLARERLTRLHESQVVEQFPVLVERVKWLWVMIGAQWTVIGYLIWKQH